MDFLISAFFILLSFGQLARIELFSSVAFLSYEVVMMLVVGLFLFEKRKDTRSYLTNNIIKAFEIFLGTLGISFLVSLSIHSVSENFVAFAYLARIILYGLFFIAVLSVKKPVLDRGLQLFIFATITFSLIQYVFVPSIQFLEPWGWDPHVMRVVGTFLDPTSAGIILSLLFFYILIQKPMSFRAKRGIWVWILTLLSLIFLILLTYSRITYIGIIAGFFHLLFKGYRVKLVTMLIAFFLISIPFLPRVSGESTNLQRTFSISSRSADIKKGIEIWKGNPNLGIGYNHIPSIKANNTAFDHSDSAYSSSYVTILATAGVVGLGVFLYLLWSLYRYSSLLGKTLTVLISVTSLVENVFLLNVVLAVYLVLIALEDNR